MCVCLGDQRMCYGSVIGIYDGHPMQKKWLGRLYLLTNQQKVVLGPDRCYCLCVKVWSTRFFAMMGND